MGFIKPVIWIGVAGTLAAGTSLAVMGPHRAQALISQAQHSINVTIDANIDDPIALRQQLRELESQYPGRIAEVRGDLAELTSQIGQLERERSVSNRVVELAQADLHEMKALLAKANAAQTSNGFVLVKVRFGDESFNVEQAYSKANQISQLRTAYSNKAADIDNNLSVLQQQESRLGQILAQLEGERTDFQGQLYQLDRQVDAIARNDRMIEMLEKRQKAFDKYTRYGQVTSPDQVQGRIAKILAEQEARLNALSTAANQNSYELQAKNELARTEYSYQAQIGAENLEGANNSTGIEFVPEIIEITPDSTPPIATSGSVASNN